MGKKAWLVVGNAIPEVRPLGWRSPRSSLSNMVLSCSRSWAALIFITVPGAAKKVAQRCHSRVWQPVMRHARVFGVLEPYTFEDVLGKSEPFSTHHPHLALSSCPSYEELWLPLWSSAIHAEEWRDLKKCGRGRDTFTPASSTSSCC